MKLALSVCCRCAEQVEAHAVLVSTLSRTQGETAEVAAAMQQAVDDVEERARQELCHASQQSRYASLTAATSCDTI